MESYNTASSQTKPRFSLTFSDGFIILFNLVARLDVTGGTWISPFVTGMSFRTVVAALSPAETWFTIGVGRSCCSCWFGSGVRWIRFLHIVVVGVSTLYNRGVDTASMTFSDRWRSLTKTSVPGPIEGKGLALCLVLNTVSCFNLLMLSRARRLSKSGHCGFSWCGITERCS